MFCYQALVSLFAWKSGGTDECDRLANGSSYSVELDPDGCGY
jgi:hypothetical protein